MGAECPRCGRDIYDSCGHCAVVDERDSWRRTAERLEGEKLALAEFAAAARARCLRAAVEGWPDGQIWKDWADGCWSRTAASLLLDSNMNETEVSDA
jgi:hypothetical protein